MQTAPYGSWKSPITAKLVATPLKFGGYGTGIPLGDQVLAARSDPADKGRVSLWQLPELVELTPDRYVRTTIHEYGGGEWTAAEVAGKPVIVYSTFPSNDLRIIENGSDRLLLPGGKFRFGGLTINAEQNLLLAVREEMHDDAEPTDAIVAISLNDPEPQAQVLVEGADFYASPTLNNKGQLVWVQWNHPNMPWDTTSLYVAEVSPDSEGNLNVENSQLIAGGDDESVVYPTWAPDGSLIFLSDKSGFWNFYRYDAAADPMVSTSSTAGSANAQAALSTEGRRSSAAEGGVSRPRPLHRNDFDFTHPMWVLDAAPYTVISAQNGIVEIGCMWLENGLSKIGVLLSDTNSGTWDLTEIPTGAVAANIRTGIASPEAAAQSGSGTASTVQLSYSDRPSQLARVDWQTKTVTPLPLPQDTDRPDLTGYLSTPQAISWESPFGIVHGWYYPPTNKDFTAPAGELPPLMVLSHGGPTSLSMPTYSLGDIQYWTSRGIGILDVNYSGSTGYGRAYRERLKGNWGIADVADCAAGAQALVARGLADPKRIAIKGGSAGGFTTLASLAFTDVYGAGISLYGIGDLEILAKDTHKFESRYLDGLVAPYPEGRDIYLERSPNYHLDQLSAPMAILQGLDDAVVPPSQAYAMADAIRAKGLPVTLITYEGEAHGFRKAETIINAAEESLKFLGSTFGFTHQP